MPIDELEGTLDRLASEGRRPKFIYTIPNFQNPGGVTMSLPRRRRLVEVARERELLVLEDNPYGLLRYEGEALPTLYSLDAEAVGRAGATDLVIYLGTFSKILSPGPAARLGGRAAAGAREAQPRQTGRRPVLLAGHADVRGGLLRRAGRRRAAGVGGVRGAPAGALQPPPRRDARVARRSTSATAPAGRPRAGACSCGPRWTSASTPPTCSRWPARARAWRSCPAAPPTWTAAAAPPRCA